MKTDAFTLQRVRFMPDSLVPGILYVSEEFETAAHLCACGCGAKIRTPLGPTEWAFEDTRTGPSLSPSIGNWQQACQSHYWIQEGRVEWSTRWSQKQIIAGRRREEERRKTWRNALDQAADNAASAVSWGPQSRNHMKGCPPAGHYHVQQEPLPRRQPCEQSRR